MKIIEQAKKRTHLSTVLAGEFFRTIITGKEIYIKISDGSGGKVLNKFEGFSVLRTTDGKVDWFREDVEVIVLEVELHVKGVKE